MTWADCLGPPTLELRVWDYTCNFGLNAYISPHNLLQYFWSFVMCMYVGDGMNDGMDTSRVWNSLPKSASPAARVGHYTRTISTSTLFGHWQLQRRVSVFFSCTVYKFAYLLAYTVVAGSLQDISRGRFPGPQLANNINFGLGLWYWLKLRLEMRLGQVRL